MIRERYNEKLALPMILSKKHHIDMKQVIPRKKPIPNFRELEAFLGSMTRLIAPIPTVVNNPLTIRITRKAKNPSIISTVVTI
ncbi:MAG: hypothetical protein ACJAT2_001232 [Bacteriovoracaceae bacterium]|jgi:hypothetical protein